MLVAKLGYLFSNMKPQFSVYVSVALSIKLL